MKTVLIIDEDAGQRRQVSEFLEDCGWRVVKTDQAAAGIELIRQHRPDAVVCEATGPGSACARFCQLLRGEAAPARLPIIAVCRQDCDCDRVTSMDAGAVECLSQPLDLDKLLAALERLTDASAASTSGSNRAGAEPSLRLKFWGVRGSVPTPGPTTVRYGGNTACVEFRAGGEIIVLDAGTGLRPLGRALAAEFKDRPLNLTILLTHTHWDHIHGLPYFMPIYLPNAHVRILGYEGARKGLASILSAQMESTYFPIGFHALPSNVVVEELHDPEFHVGPVRVQAHRANHPGACFGYRLFAALGSVAFFPDNELACPRAAQAGSPAPCEAPDPSEEARNEALVKFLDGVDALIIDAQYTASEYVQHVGWGHGCVDQVVELAVRAQAKQLFLFHHDPDHDDAQIEQIVGHARQLARTRSQTLRVDAAQEGRTVELPVPAAGGTLA